MDWIHSSTLQLSFPVVLCVLLFRDKKMEDTYFDKETEKAFLKASGSLFETKVSPTMLLARENGNMYTGSMYGGVLSLLAQ